MSQHDEKTLIRKRSSFKSKVTHFSNFLQKFESSGQPSDKTIAELIERLNKFEAINNEYDEIQTQLEVLQEDATDQYLEREEFEKTYYELLSHARCLLRSGSPQISNSVNKPCNANPENGSNYSSGHVIPTSVKLPEIKLPTFKGDFDQWIEYREVYVSLIHENANISDIQKFHYLRASLDGTAAQVIKSIEFSANNYKTAWDVLCKRFNNTNILIYNHLESLITFEKMKKGSSVKIRQLIDTVGKHLRALDILGQKTEYWDTLIIHLISKGLDDLTLAKWEELKTSRITVTLEDWFEFLRNRADIIEKLDVNRQEGKREKEVYGKTKALVAINSENDNVYDRRKCILCSKEHKLHECEKFKNLSVSERLESCHKYRLCHNCLRAGHMMKYCKLYGLCKKCKGKHHTLIHKDKEHSTVSCTSKNVSFDGETLLSTVTVNVTDSDDKVYAVRALLDSGSQSSFISESLCRKLDLKLSDVQVMVSGLSNHVNQIKKKTNVDITSRFSNFHLNLTCLVIAEITGILPASAINVSELNIPKNIILADLNFGRARQVDMLIGADAFWHIIQNGRIELGLNKPILQNTAFGWVVAGKWQHSQKGNELRCNFSKNVSYGEIQDQLERFFQVEEVPVRKPWSKEDQKCEDIFQKTRTRLEDGRFQVQIPLRRDASSLGESRHYAEKRFRALENKLQKNETLRGMYSDFIHEYEKLGHMERCLEKGDVELAYYLPHHGVLKEDSTTTKLRVVFDASAKTSSGQSFNDIQMVGPVIQDELFSVLLRFRQHTVVFTADVEKMYRQIEVEPQQRNLQRILWRAGPDHELVAYTLKTVTYGTASAPFLAIRCLKELSEECKAAAPELSEIIARDFYVDDLLSGCETDEKGLFLCRRISKILMSGCFPLRKWRSNSKDLLEALEADKSEQERTNLVLGGDECKSTLGLMWSSFEDVLLYKIECESKNTVTKRLMLSYTAKIFDPLGLLNPCTILAKIMLQKLWRERLEWDQPVSEELHRQWNRLMSDVSVLNKLRIQRHVMLPESKVVELHMFSDASEVAYGACAYLLSIDGKGNKRCKLLCAKGKVAPIKSMTIPRLELCAAYVSAKLAQKVIESLRLQIKCCTYWTDSQVVLGWINASTSILKPFVRNRVAEIQEKTDVLAWRYVPTGENPADLLSRGVSPVALKDAFLWWHGPEWLLQPETVWPKKHKDYATNTLPEIKSCVTSVVESFEFPFERFSNLNRLQGCVAYLQRFITNCKVAKEKRITGVLTLEELEQAMVILIKITQAEAFGQEIGMLIQGKSLEKHHKLLSLNPFVDKIGLLRVGGRLTYANLEYDKRHPIILPARHWLTKLLFIREHKKLLHVGPQQLLYSVREKFWPISGPNIAKQVVRECIKCHRFRAKAVQPVMGNLPKTRTIAAFPFYITGIDYAGPFMIREKRGRGSKLRKAYVSLFICFATKCIHLELVSDLTTNNFLLALKRFVARRGKPLHIYSDNGTNFVGAQRELKELTNLVKANIDEIELLETFTNDQGIHWHFGPPYAPNFGGLWEAGVKSTKHHLKRVLNNDHLTFEEFTTLLVQIEAILNSRPLTPLSNDPDDFTPLTPAHLLIGRPLTSTLEADLQNISQNRLTIYQ
ncbi:uncharacterized protein [Onthophagus taurus]|uniref:uncharacterized protein n=1 Tax=Onthophagus taurus TaxID=166361 RepID=UPI0039BE95E5